MSERFATMVTAAAVVLGLSAVVTLALGRHVTSGVLFLCTAISIYIRETQV